MTLPGFRGQVVLLVFWATWCGPCMAMVPRERELAKRYASRPFALVGVNGDGDILYGPNNERIDQKAKVREVMREKGITWPSFRDYLIKEKVQISRRWNADAWPTVYLLDHRGVIRHKFTGAPYQGGPRRRGGGARGRRRGRWKSPSPTPAPGGKWRSGLMPAGHYLGDAKSGRVNCPWRERARKRS